MSVCRAIGTRFIGGHCKSWMLVLKGVMLLLDWVYVH